MAENHLAFGVLCYSSMAYSTLTDIFTYEEKERRYVYRTDLCEFLKIVSGQESF